MKYFSTIFAIIFSGLMIPVASQDSKHVQKADEIAGLSDKNKIRTVIFNLFNGMRSADTAALTDIFTPDARLNSTSVDIKGESRITGMGISDFINQIGMVDPGMLDERVKSMKIHIDKPLATAWVEYDFYLNGQFHHCGYDAFQLFDMDGAWKIFQIADTRKQYGCLQVEQQINQILDNWHKSASISDFNAYFKALAPDGRFLGTDAIENWDKSSFMIFAKPRFEDGQAWDFKVMERNLYKHENGEVAWFDELLDTWMGTCRGSGVLVKTDGDWLISHYNLSILVPNELVQDYLKLLNYGKQ